ncbi:universal stress protein [Serpens gallinarum]|uniref:Universal stress protein n=1 Tax=Serpens gallinarum TaxID=2763075 RepID=A0ABR8TLD2_9PSED|nr:universal stress protein [Serpens gallinarum]MBD7976335.1 universal stress protein [Serpens gallinarum]
MNTHQLLVVIDPTQEVQPALQRAAWLARQTGAAMELLLCEYHSALEGGLLDGPRLEHARRTLLEQRLAWLQQLADPLRAGGLTVTCEARWGRPLHKMILARVIELQPDLLFKSGHQHGLLQRLFTTNTCWQLIRQCHCPLWLTGDLDWQPKRLCAAVDPLHAADKPASLDHQLIETARQLAATFNLQEHIVHSYGPVPNTLIFDVDLATTYEQYREEEAKAHREAFAALLDSHPGSAANSHLLEGYAEQTIPRFVKEQGIDLMLMGAIARGSLDNALIGNTAERILEAVHCDLLVLKPAQFGSAQEQ